VRNKLEEIWKDIPGYEGWYQVSNLGRVKRLKRTYVARGVKYVKEKEYILQLCTNTKGYYQCFLTNNGEKRRECRVHRLVAEAFIPNPENKPMIDHINQIKTDNRVENLRWVTNGENQLNTQKNIFLELNGETKHISEWSSITGISIGVITNRLRRGWSIEETLNIPVVKYQKIKRKAVLNNG
jgi:hypothetical protein